MREIHQNPNFGTHNTSPRYGQIKYIVIHYVGATGGAEANVKYYNQRTTTNASADFYVGHNGEIWQYNPDPQARYCWAVGGRKQSSYGGTLYGIATNANCVSIEMCVRNNGNMSAGSSDWYFETATIDSAVDLTMYLMHKYGIDSNHVIRHFDVNGKYCPGVRGWIAPLGAETAWNAFKARISGGASNTTPEPEKPVSGAPAASETVSGTIYRVRKSWADASSQIGAFSVYENAKAYVDAHEGYTVYDGNGKALYSGKGSRFMVYVDINDLNIRKGAGTNYAKTGAYTGKGVFTIVETADGQGSDTGWGKLLSGAGWISLDFVTRL